MLRDKVLPFFWRTQKRLWMGALFFIGLLVAGLIMEIFVFLIYIPLIDALQYLTKEYLLQTGISLILTYYITGTIIEYVRKKRG